MIFDKPSYWIALSMGLLLPELRLCCRGFLFLSCLLTEFLLVFSTVFPEDSSAPSHHVSPGTPTTQLIRSALNGKEISFNNSSSKPVQYEMWFFYIWINSLIIKIKLRNYQSQDPRPSFAVYFHFFPNCGRSHILWLPSISMYSDSIWPEVAWFDRFCVCDIRICCYGKSYEF